MDEGFKWQSSGDNKRHDNEYAATMCYDGRNELLHMQVPKACVTSFQWIHSTCQRLT